MTMQLHEFWRRSNVERRLVIESTTLLLGLRIALAVFPFRFVRRLASSVGSWRSSALVPARQVAWAVRAVAPHLPGTSTCLMQALAAQALLTRYGHPARLLLGVARDPSRLLLAHAWVEGEDGVLIGGDNLERYARLEQL